MGAVVIRALLVTPILLFAGCNLITGAGELRAGEAAGSNVPGSGDPDSSASDASGGGDGGAGGGSDASGGGDGGASDASSGGGDAGIIHPFVFVTSTTMTGAFGGPDLADGICNELAAAAHLSGRYTAWVSAEGAPALVRITATGPWHNAAGQIAVASRATLTSGSIGAAIGYDETGTARAVHVWTGTAANGKLANQLCGAWSNASASSSGEFGLSTSTDNAWTDVGNEQCNNSLALYCFEN